MKLKKVLTILTAILVVSSTSVALSVSAEDTTSSANASSAIGASSFTGTVSRVTAGALMVKPDASAGLGESVAVVYSSASNFAVDDVVTVEYSGEINDANGVKSVSADNITKNSASNNILAETKAPEEESTNLLDNTSETTAAAASDGTTPGTGDAGVSLPITAAVTSFALASVAAFAINKNKRKK